MKKIVVLVLMVAFALTIFAGCSSAQPNASASGAPAVSEPAASEPAASAPAASEPAAPAKKIKIGFSQKVLNAPFFVALADAVKNEATKRGWEAVVLDAKQDIETEAQNLESFIAQGCDFVFVNAIDPKAAVAPVNAVVEAGIPVIELDADIDAAANVITTVQTDNLGSGRQVGLKIPSYYEKDEKISAVLIDGNKGNTGGQARRTGLFQGIIEQRIGCTEEESLKLAQAFDQELQNTGKAINEKANFEVVGQAWGNWNSDEGLAAAEDLLVAHPNVNCMLSENDGMLIGGLEAVKDAKLENQIKLFTSNDAQKEGLKLILDGTAYKMTGENRPLKVAELGVKIAEDILDIVYKSRSLDVVKRSLEQYRDNLKTLYQQVTSSDDIIESPSFDSAIPGNLHKLFNFTLYRDCILSTYSSFYSQVLNTPKSSFIVQKCIDYIHENYANPINLASISEEFNISYSYLSYLFVKMTNMKMHHYINNVRIEHAKKLLKTSSMKMYDIAQKVGFESPYYFSKVFKETTGLTCSEYKKGQKSISDLSL